MTSYARPRNTGLFTPLGSKQPTEVEKVLILPGKEKRGSGCQIRNVKHCKGNENSFSSVYEQRML